MDGDNHWDDDNFKNRIETTLGIVAVLELATILKNVGHLKYTRDF